MQKGEAESARLVHENARLQADIVTLKAESQEKISEYSPFYYRIMKMWLKYTLNNNLTHDISSFKNSFYSSTTYHFYLIK